MLFLITGGSGFIGSNLVRFLTAQGDGLHEFVAESKPDAVLHLCKAIEAVVSRGRVGETYTVGGNNEMRNIDLMKKLCGIMDSLQPRANGKPYEELITYVTDCPGHDMRYAIDASKLMRELGWEPDCDHSSLLQETVEWYLKNERWWMDILSGSYRLERLGIENHLG
ncbi:MAG: GDP-mannose 4,6-dehydratase [Pirellula sp.]